MRGSDGFLSPYGLGSVALGLVQSPSAIDGGLRGDPRSPFFHVRTALCNLLEL